MKLQITVERHRKSRWVVLGAKEFDFDKDQDAVAAWMRGLGVPTGERPVPGWAVRMAFLP